MFENFENWHPYIKYAFYFLVSVGIVFAVFLMSSNPASGSFSDFHSLKSLVFISFITTAFCIMDMATHKIGATHKEETTLGGAKITEHSFLYGQFLRLILGSFIFALTYAVQLLFIYFISLV